MRCRLCASAIVVAHRSSTAQVCHVKGEPSHKIVSDARSLLCNMTHRGATGADARDGDGAGVMIGMPDAFFRREAEREIGHTLPPLGQYAVGNVFFKPRDADTLAEHKSTFEGIAESLNLRVLDWREVPRDNTILGPAALSREPLILQPIVVLATSYGSGNKPEVRSRPSSPSLPWSRPRVAAISLSDPSLTRPGRRQLRRGLLRPPALRPP